ncbi:MAG TPA: hypothetical protein VMZ22_07285 [Acidimicrobiales bacterium]|nr:hypothetical protein [Acidimicrobiales bacterium]
MARARAGEISEELNEVWRLVVGYTKQETAAPLRGLGRFIRLGIGGMVMFAIGTGFGVMAILRAFQSETTLDNGNWSVVPYVVAIVWCGIVGALAVRSVARTPWKRNEGDAK